MRIDGRELERLYQGGPFPPYLADIYGMILTVAPLEKSENSPISIFRLYPASWNTLSTWAELRMFKHWICSLGL